MPSAVWPATQVPKPVGAVCWRKLARAARRQLRKLPPDETARARAPVLGLGFDPRPPGAGPLVGSPFWRLRVGELRVIYATDDTARTVVVLRVARRSESTYRRVR